MNARHLVTIAALVLIAPIAALAQGGPKPSPLPPTAAPSAPAGSAAAQPPPGIDAEVIEVVDGDRLVVRKVGDKPETSVELIGIDAPQVSTREKAGQEPFGTMALQFLSVAITRKVVRIELDASRTNEAGDLLGYVWSGDKLMNEEMLKAGLAMLATVPPNVKYVDRLTRAQADARAAKRGVWWTVAPMVESPSQFRAGERQANEKQAKTEGSLELPGYADGCAIGNRQTKKYHLPGGAYYDKAKGSKNAIFFNSGADAEKAGYTKSAR